MLVFVCTCFFLHFRLFVLGVWFAFFIICIEIFGFRGLFCNINSVLAKTGPQSDIQVPWICDERQRKNMYVYILYIMYIYYIYIYIYIYIYTRVKPKKPKEMGKDSYERNN